MLLQPIFDYLASPANADKLPNGNFLMRTKSRRRPLFPKYGGWSLMSCESYMSKGFGFIIDVVTGKRIVFVLCLVGLCWLMLFVRLSFIEVWRQTALDSYRLRIEQQLSDMDTHLVSSYRHIRRLDPDRQLKVRDISSPGISGQHMAKRKIIIFSYKSAGASRFAEMFNQDPRAVLWYEILEPFYTSYFGLPPSNYPSDITHMPDGKRRDLDREEGDWITDYIRRIFHCDPANLPIEAILHNHLLNLKLTSEFKECYESRRFPITIDDCADIIAPICGTTVPHATKRQCQKILNAARKLRHKLPLARSTVTWDMDANNTEIFSNYLHNLLGEDANLLSHGVYRSLPKFLGHQLCLVALERQAKDCMPIAVEACRDKIVQATQIERMNAEGLRLILRDYPHTQVVYHVRDPRGIATTRMKLYPNSAAESVVEEAKAMCTQMIADYWEMVKLQNHYIHTSFVVVKYEDMVIYPYEVAVETYNFLGLTTPESFKLYVENGMLVNKAEYMYGAAAANMTQEDLYHWRQELSKADLKEINHHCRDALFVFQYMH